MNGRYFTMAALAGASYFLLSFFLFLIIPHSMMVVIHSTTAARIIYVLMSAFSMMAMGSFFLVYPNSRDNQWSKVSGLLLATGFGIAVILQFVKVILITMNLDVISFIQTSRYLIYLPIIITILLIYFFGQFIKYSAEHGSKGLQFTKALRYLLFIPLLLAFIYFIHNVYASPITDWFFQNKYFFNQISSLITYFCLTAFFWKSLRTE